VRGLEEAGLPVEGQRNVSGYVPVFSSVYDGSLHGKWPDAAVFVSILPLANKDGEIRMTVEAIQARTGWPMKWLRQGIDNLMQPDPMSQSDAEEGRRLIPIKPGLPWGWKVVNHAKYREKARKRAHNETAQLTGENKERMKERREEDQELTEKTGRDQTGPDVTGADRLSDTDTNTGGEPRKRGSRRCPEGHSVDLAYARQQVPDIDAEAEEGKFRDWEFKSPRRDWDATWRNWIRSCKETGRYARKAASNGGIHAGIRMS
jgi:hypothetical protein